MAETGAIGLESDSHVNLGDTHGWNRGSGVMRYGIADERILLFFGLWDWHRCRFGDGPVRSLYDRKACYNYCSLMLFKSPER